MSEEIARLLACLGGEDRVAGLYDDAGRAIVPPESEPTGGYVQSFRERAVFMIASRELRQTKHRASCRRAYRERRAALARWPS